MDEVIGLFPVPFQRSPATLPPALVDRLIASFAASAVQANNASANLSHTRMLKPHDDALLVEAGALIAPKLAEFGTLLFGERLDWSIKEMWVNVLDRGGRQAMHNHANSFASGVVYLTPVHASACTVFMKSPGGTDFIFRNDHSGVTGGPYTSDKWISPEPSPGDLVLFPSYLMHAVPPNAGARRITLSFNAIPSRMESWGYGIGFSA